MFVIRGVFVFAFFYIVSATTRIQSLRPNFPLRVDELWCDPKYPLTLTRCMMVEFSPSAQLCQVVFGLRRERFMAVPMTNTSQCNLSFEAHFDKSWYYRFCIGSTSCLPYTNTFNSIGSARITYRSSEEWYSGFWIDIMDSGGTRVSTSIKL